MATTWQDRLRAAVRAFRATSDEPRPDHRTDNFGYNRALWNDYSRKWSDPQFRARQLAEETPDAAVGADDLEVLGEEWGRPADVERVLAEWITPYLGPDKLVAEIGSGGGRVARRVLPEVARLYCFDNSDEMLGRLVTALGSDPRLEAHLLESPRLPADLTGRLDFVYAFDVFVHFDLHLLRRYVEEIARVLKPGGVTFVHTSNITAPRGWPKFAAQETFVVEGHYPMSPDLVRTVLERSGLTVERESTPDESNFYLARDYLAIARKP